jgi:mitochondrial protein import protein ZIM17
MLATLYATKAPSQPVSTILSFQSLSRAPLHFRTRTIFSSEATHEMAARGASSAIAKLGRLGWVSSMRQTPALLHRTTRQAQPLLFRERTTSFIPPFSRLAHNIPRPLRADSSATSDRLKAKRQEPHYELTFTCIPCGERSSHVVSKQGYHHGSVLISCPGCRNRHVISDHLRIFGDKSVTVEDLMRDRGRLVKRGTLGEDGDLEFWEDGTVTPHEGGAGEAARGGLDGKQDNEALSAPGATFKSTGEKAT